MEREVLLAELPKYQRKYKLISPTQTVAKIRGQLMKSHDENAGMYDKIAPQFVRRGMPQTFESLWTWVKDNVRYEEETEHRQVIKTPGALIETGVGDCKSMASFVGGVLDAMKRMGKRLNWRYVFAGYGDTNHVFVEADSGGKDYWIDPVLGEFDIREPRPITIKKFEKDMALYTLSGVGCASCVGNKMGTTVMQAQDCFLPYESIDEQMIRLTKCQSGGGGQIIPFEIANDLYEIPIQTGPPLTSPIDATPLDPGTPETMNPAPPPGPSPSPSSDTGIMGWVSENPLLSALIAAGIVVAVSRKKKRKKGSRK
jgi:hypothetical protein